MIPFLANPFLGWWYPFTNLSGMGAGVWRDAAVRDGKPLTSEGAVEGRPALWFGSFASSKLAEVGVLACSLLSWPGSSKGHLSPEVGVVG